MVDTVYITTQTLFYFVGKQNHKSEITVWLRVYQKPSSMGLRLFIVFTTPVFLKQNFDLCKQQT